MITTLANARRTVASLAGRLGALEAWFAVEIGRSGIRENAAVLAVAESSPPAEADDLISAFLDRHGAHAAIAEDLRIAVLRPP
jgi:hypothetical protein